MPRYAAFMAASRFEGDVEAAPLWAGEPVEMVKALEPAADIVYPLVHEADSLLQTS